MDKQRIGIGPRPTFLQVGYDCLTHFLGQWQSRVAASLTATCIDAFFQSMSLSIAKGRCAVGLDDSVFCFLQTISLWCCPCRYFVSYPCCQSSSNRAYGFGHFGMVLLGRSLKVSLKLYRRQDTSGGLLADTFW
jgi:hypothetical protein